VDAQQLTGTSLHDLESMHLKETLAMLCLAVAQIKTSMTDSTESVNELTHSFAEMTHNFEAIGQSVKSIDSFNDVQALKDELLRDLSTVSSSIHESVVAFQFYDRISQRLNHVADSLDQLGSLIGNPVQLDTPDAWNSLQLSIKSSYTMEAERIMFEHVMDGASVAKALEIYQHYFDEKAGPANDGTADDIELF